MARSFSGTAQYLKKTSAVVAGMPLSLACWFNLNAINLDQVLLAVSANTSTHHSTVDMVVSAANNKLNAEIINDGGTVDDQTAICATVLAAGAWHHGCAVYASATSRTCYLDGGGAVSSAVNCTLGTLDTSSVGMLASAALAVAALTNGVIAFPAFWSVALSSAEVAALAAGADPRLIQPANLKSFSWLSGGSSPEQDLMSATGWTLTGAPTNVANPRIYLAK